MLPIVPASGKRGAFVSGELAFEGDLPAIRDPCPLKDALIRAHGITGENDPIILLDIDGFSERFLNGELVKEIRIRGRDLWFVTYIENLEDVIGALSGSFSGLGIPMHTVREENLMDLASEMSDSVFSVAFIKDGKELSTGRRPDELVIILRKKGVQRLVCIDTDRAEAQESVLFAISEEN